MDVRLGIFRWAVRRLESFSMVPQVRGGELSISRSGGSIVSCTFMTPDGQNTIFRPLNNF